MKPSAVSSTLLFIIDSKNNYLISIWTVKALKGTLTYTTSFKLSDDRTCQMTYLQNKTFVEQNVENKIQRNETWLERIRKSWLENLRNQKITSQEKPNRSFSIVWIKKKSWGTLFM